MTDTKPLTERLEIKAMMIQMGERIAYGSDSGIMHEAVTALKKLAAERDAMLDRVEKAEKDAERYRWLRERHDESDTQWHVRGHFGSPVLSGQLDTSIDSAMEASK